MPTVKLTKRVVDAATPGRGADGATIEQNYWDTIVHGFGLRVSPAGAKTYVLVYRIGGGRRGRQRRYRIGTPGSPWTVETARKEAEKVRGRVAHGADPAGERQADRAAATVAELCDLYLKRVEAGEVRTRMGRPKRASTVATDRGRIERHIKPVLGKRRVADLTPQDIRRFIAAVARGDTKADVKTKKRGRAIVTGGEGTASRTAGLLSGILSFAVDEGMRSDNPAHGVERAKDGKRDRILSPAEYRRLGGALEALQAKKANPWGIAATRLLALTGARRGEILGLRRDAIDPDRQTLTLEESKTGRSVRPIGKPAIEVVRSVKGVKGNPYLFPASRGEGGHYLGLPRFFRDLCGAAKLKDATPHVLRHSFASVANELGYAEPTIAALLGHARHTTTSRYVHVVDAALVAAADEVSVKISDMMGLPMPDADNTDP